MEEPLRLAIIVGSTRPNRFAPTVAGWFVDLARWRHDMIVDVIDLAEVRLPDVLAHPPPTEVAAVSPRLAASDAFVVVTPEYNHSFPAPLKSAIDWHHEEWRAKPIAFVSYGGRSGGLRAVEHLRHVFVELHATTIRNTVSFHLARRQFDADGRPKNRDEAESAARSMLDQLSWWAVALRDARRTRPYPT
jgi:NAD(P)H-dependent FMN reductase